LILALSRDVFPSPKAITAACQSILVPVKWLEIAAVVEWLNVRLEHDSSASLMSDRARGGRNIPRWLAVEYGWRVQRHSGAWHPPTDVYENEDAFIVIVEIGGMRQGEFAVNIDRQLLSIRGVRHESEGMKVYHQMEIAYGDFLSEVRIPKPVISEEIKAMYGDGFLRVILPKVKDELAG
jgi:HSP20 family protein